MGSLVDEKRLLLKVPERCRMGTLSAEKDMVRGWVCVYVYVYVYVYMYVYMCVYGLSFP